MTARPPWFAPVTVAAKLPLWITNISGFAERLQAQLLDKERQNHAGNTALACKVPLWLIVMSMSQVQAHLNGQYGL